jgi:hypothetical protein
MAKQSAAKKKANKKPTVYRTSSAVPKGRTARRLKDGQGYIAVKKRKNLNMHKRYIYRVFNSLSDSKVGNRAGFSKKGMNVFNSMVEYCVDGIMKTVHELLQATNTSTCLPKHVETATKLFVPDQDIKDQCVKGGNDSEKWSHTRQKKRNS